MSAISPSLTFNGTINMYHINWLVVFSTIAFTLLIGLVVAAGVAWGAVRVRPLEVLRYE